jgi:hypothetical protein
VAARVALAAAAIRLARDDPEGSATLQGLAVALRGAVDESDIDARALAERTSARIGADRFGELYRAATMVPRPQARSLVTAAIGAGTP